MLPANRRLTRLVLTPGSATPGGSRGGPRRGSPAAYDSTGRRRSPWRLVSESPVSQRRASSGTPLSAQRPSPLALASPAAAASPAAHAGADRWQRLQQQLLQRCQGEGGGVRVTAAKPAVRPAAAAAASPAAQLAAPAAPPAPVPELPAFSLAGVQAQPAAPAAKAPAAPPAPAAFGSVAAFGAASAPAFGAAPVAGFGVAFGAASPSSSATSSGALLPMPSLLLLMLRLLLAGGLLPPLRAICWPNRAALARPPACRPGDAAGAFFLPAAPFEGARPGYVFKMDGSGLGYYRDAPLPTAGSLFGAGRCSRACRFTAAHVAPVPLLPLRAPCCSQALRCQPLSWRRQASRASSPSGQAQGGCLPAAYAQPGAGSRVAEAAF